MLSFVHGSWRFFSESCFHENRATRERDRTMNNYNINWDNVFLIHWSDLLHTMAVFPFFLNHSVQQARSQGSEKSKPNLRGLNTSPSTTFHATSCPSSWWRHQMVTFSALLALCAGNSPVTGEFPAKRPVARSVGVFLDLRLNKCCWWFETPSPSLWRHCNAM